MQAVDTNKIATIILTDGTTINPREELDRISSDSRRLHISLPAEISTNVLEEALGSKRFETILVDGPVTLSYFDIQRLASLAKANENTRVLVGYDLRSRQKIHNLRENIQKALMNGDEITSLIIRRTVGNKDSNTSVEARDIDLLLFLSGKKVTSVHASREGIIQEGGDGFNLLTGTFESVVPFIVQISQDSGKEKESVLVKVELSSGETLSTSTRDFEAFLPNISIQSLFDADKDKLASLHDISKALRVLICAQQSFLTEKRVILKYVEEDIVPIRTVGTATFLQTGLFLPVSLNKKMALVGVFSNKQEKIKDIFNRVASTGEPLEYQLTYESLFSNQFPKTPRPIFYVPSLVGKRKNQEMTDALKAGYLVLAEKPAFPNVDIAREFSKTLNGENMRRLFFGWHYQYHFVFQKLWKDISNNTFGKIKHIRTYFSAPKIYSPKARVFDPLHGGAGNDIYSYNLHFTLRLIGFGNSFEVIKSNIQSAQELDPNDPKLSKIDFHIESQITFENGVTADLTATFDSKTVLHTEAEILFEEGTRILCKEFVHPQHIIALNGSPIIIHKTGSPKWEDYISAEEKKSSEYLKTTYYQQMEFIRKQATGEQHYDPNKDEYGIGVESNVRLHEIIDEVFQKGGFEKKIGA